MVNFSETEQIILSESNVQNLTTDKTDNTDLHGLNNLNFFKSVLSVFINSALSVFICGWGLFQAKLRDGAGSAEGKAAAGAGSGSVWARFISKYHFQIS